MRLAKSSFSSLLFVWHQGAVYRHNFLQRFCVAFVYEVVEDAAHNVLSGLQYAKCIGLLTSLVQDC
jgi:hypothetical protein